MVRNVQPRDEMIDDMALPFLDLAEKLEAARVNGADRETFRAILETNLFLWRFMTHFLPRHFEAEAKSETIDLLKRISEFMAKVTVAMDGDPSQDPDLIRKVVQMNLNMCDQILAMGEQIPASSA